MSLFDLLTGRKDEPVDDSDPFAAPQFERLRDPAADPPSSPLLRSVAAAAKKRGISTEELLKRDLEAALSSPYPTDACLTIGELEALAADRNLPEDRRDHAAECEFCLGALSGMRDAPRMADAAIAAIHQYRSAVDSPHRRPASRDSGGSAATAAIEYFDRDDLAWSYKGLPAPAFLSEA